jgi:ADP-ribose pyrophosphatase YjhB (NUDIX family)
VEARQVFGVLPVGWEDLLLIKYCPRCGTPCHDVRINGLTRSRCPFCSYVHFVNPAPGVVVVVELDGRVLMCRRGQDIGCGGLWCLPGGHIEFNEDFITAGLREVQEETGLQVEVKSILSVVSNFWDHGHSTFVAVLLASPLHGELRADGHETTELAWFTADDLPRDEIAFVADEHIIARYFATRDAGATVDPEYMRLERDGSYVPPPASRHAW